MATSTIPNVNGYMRNLQQVLAGGSASLTIADNTRAILAVVGGSSRVMCFIMVSCSGTGTVSVGQMSVAENCYITAESPGSNQLTVSNGATGVNPNLYGFVMTGGVTRNS